MTRHPLSWPAGRSRTPCHRRERPKFTAGSFADARDGLLAELRRLGARDVILSTNVSLRQDGLPYANQRQPDDTGVAVYFNRKGRPTALACDRWVRVEDNMRAIEDAINCIRMIERRGTGDMVDAAFTGFQQLGPARRPWREVLGVSDDADREAVEVAARREAMTRHPDRGGSPEAWNELQDAIRDATQESAK